MTCARPTSENKWEEEAGLNFNEEEWETIYVNPYKLTKNTRIIQFHYKITHRILACKEKLYTWKIKDNNICDRCNLDIDRIEHHLVMCPIIFEFWDSFFKWWKNTIKVMFPIDTYDILFGLSNPNEDIIINQINFATLHAMFYIYNCNQKQERPELYYFLMELKGTMEIMKINMASECKEEKFNKAWAELYECM